MEGRCQVAQGHSLEGDCLEEADRGREGVGSVIGSIGSVHGGSFD